MAGMLAFTTMQPIAGVDMHTSLPPIPTVILPHVVVWGTGISLSMGLPQALTASQAMSPNHPKNGAKPIAVGFGYACGRGHDAGVHFGHIAANTLLAIIWLGAASKAEFGSGTVLVQGQHMAVNMMLFMNIQLHCGDPVPMPTGFTFATGSNLVYANFTFMDLLNGFVHMLVDVLIVAILNFILAGVGSVLGRLLKGTGMVGLLSELTGNAKGVVNDLEDVLGRKLSNGKRVIDWSGLTPRGFFKQVSQLGNNIKFGFPEAEDYARSSLAKSAKSVIPGWLVGSPTGASASPALSPGAQSASSADSGIDSLFY
jgi:hypothetical protein